MCQSSSQNEQRMRAMSAFTRRRNWIGCGDLLLLIVATVILGYHWRGQWLPLIGAMLDVPPELRPADVIIVLGGGDGDREDYGTRLYRQGLAPHVISTGAPLGSDAAAQELIQRGVPRQAIVLANGTQNTHDDALRSRQLMEDHGWHTALLVTDPYHMRRSLWTFRTVFQGTALQIWPAPVDSGWFDARHWWQSEAGFLSVNEEYLKLIYYLLRGYIAPTIIMER